MAQLVSRQVTQSMNIPLISSDVGPTVINSNGDLTYVYNINPPANAVPVDRGVPQVLYAHNVMPSTNGLESISFNPKYAGSPGVNKFQKIQLIVASVDGVRSHIALDPELGHTAKVLRQDGTWSQPAGTPGPLGPQNVISVATINGVSYICFATAGIFKYHYDTNTLELAPIVGLDFGQIQGIVASKGYLIAYSKTGYNWSATNDPMDFTPSDVSGAGGGAVQEARGPIVWAQETAYGFILYTEANVIGVTYTGNSNYPFMAKELQSAGGISDGDMVSKESTGTQYAYTTNGIQTIYHTGVQTTLPNVTDFLGGKIFEDFNESTGQLEVSVATTPFRKKVTLINDRYLVLSYGLNPSVMMTHAIVVDLVQQRMGKLKIPHNACFELKTLAPEAGDTPRESIAFLHEDGTVNVVDFNNSNLADVGVMIMGKYQYVRQMGVNLEEAEVENVPDGSNFACKMLPITTGKNWQPAVSSTVIDSGGGSRRLGFGNSPTCRSFGLLFTGTFNLMGLVLYTQTSGKFW